MAKGGGLAAKTGQTAPLDSAPLAVTVRGIFSPGPGGDAQAGGPTFGGVPSPPGTAAWPLSRRTHERRASIRHDSVGSASILPRLCQKVKAFDGRFGKKREKSQLWDMKKVKVPVATVSPDTLVSSTWMTERW